MSYTVLNVWRLLTYMYLHQGSVFTDKIGLVSAKKNSRFSAENIDWMRHISIILNKYLHVVFKALSKVKSIFKTSTIATGVRELWK